MRHIPFHERPTCTPDEACQASGLTRSKLWEVMKAKEIAFIKAGGRRLVLVPSLLEYLSPQKKVA